MILQNPYTESIRPKDKEGPNINKRYWDDSRTISSFFA